MWIVKYLHLEDPSIYIYNGLFCTATKVKINNMHPFHIYSCSLKNLRPQTNFIALPALISLPTISCNCSFCHMSFENIMRSKSYVNHYADLHIAPPSYFLGGRVVVV